MSMAASRTAGGRRRRSPQANLLVARLPKERIPTGPCYHADRPLPLRSATVKPAYPMWYIGAGEGGRFAPPSNPPTHGSAPRPRQDYRVLHHSPGASAPPAPTARGALLPRTPASGPSPDTRAKAPPWQPALGSLPRDPAGGRL